MSRNFSNTPRRQKERKEMGESFFFLGDVHNISDHAEIQADLDELDSNERSEILIENMNYWFGSRLNELLTETLSHDGRTKSHRSLKKNGKALVNEWSSEENDYTCVNARWLFSQYQKKRAQNYFSKP